MDETRIIELVVAYSRGDLSPREAKELRRWLEDSPEHVRLFQDYIREYSRVRKLVFSGEIQEEKAWISLRKRIHKKQINIYYRMAVAVCLLACIVGGYLLLSPREEVYEVADIHPGGVKAIWHTSSGEQIELSDTTSFTFKEVDGTEVKKESGNDFIYRQLPDNKSKSEMVFNTIQVPRAGEYAFSLPDGTRVWLNSETVLRFPLVFDTLSRTIYLEGEAYFDVVKDEKKPFLVVCGNRTVRVLGTKFNVSAYKEQEEMVTTLVEGSVLLAEGNSKRVLRPGEQGVLKQGTIEIKQVDVSVFTAWVHGIFEFEDMPLVRITEQLERWYDVDFIYFDHSLEQITFTGTASRQSNLSELLVMMEQLANVKFTLNENKIVVTHK